ncbi:ABC transporter substrate-binding protein [Clostridium hydrogeniformans]|uniref:ABC transporter substrate-binding protein n=1 Tax=Clostridium hydrogeniformans TaxID=349933 RepID=UPI0004893F42|nr:extracellular solute-binding protein [Clostridium hydrogeniformans]
MKNKYISILLLIIILSFTLSSCTAGKKDKRKFTGELKILTFKEYEGYFNKASEVYREEHRDVKIDIKVIDKNNLKNEIKDSIKEGREYDIVSTTNMEVYDFYNDLEYIHPYVSDFIKDFDNKKLESLKTYGALKVFPMNVEVMGIYYRDDILKSMGVTALDINTWEDLLNLGIKLKEKHGIKLLSANIKGKNSIYSLLINQLLTNYRDKDRKVTLASEESIKALNLIKKLKDLDLINIIPEEEDGEEDFFKGETLSFIGSNRSIEKIKNLVKDNNYNEKIVMNKIPAFEPGGNRSVISITSDIGVMNNAKNKELAKDFIKTLLTDKVVLIEGITNNYMLPLYKPIYFNDSIDKSIDFLNNDKVLRRFEYTSRDAYMREVDNMYKEIDKFIGGNILEVIKNKDIKNNIKDYEKKLNETIYEKEIPLR